MERGCEESSTLSPDVKYPSALLLPRISSLPIDATTGVSSAVQLDHEAWRGDAKTVESGARGAEVLW